MSRDEIIKRYPNASESFIRANLNPNAGSSGIRPTTQKPTKRVPLDDAIRPEEKNWYNAAVSFEIVFTIYSRRPADYDGYDIKALQDFLVKAGIITDDRWDVLAGRVVSRKAATEGEERTEIQITAIV